MCRAKGVRDNGLSYFTESPEELVAEVAMLKQGFTTRHGERNQVFCRLSQANRCFLSILERQKCLSKRKTWFLIFDVG